MGRLIKAVMVLALFGLLGLVGYAYLADLTPAVQEIRVPVVLDAR